MKEKINIRHGEMGISKWISVMGVIDNKKSLTDTSKKTDTTYSHLIKIINTLETKGYVKKEKNGRKNIISLTKRGEKLQLACFEILRTKRL